MAKFIRILAASLGGGLVLGASIRLGERLGAGAARGNPEPEAIPRSRIGSALNARLDRLEESLTALPPHSQGIPAADAGVTNRDPKLPDQFQSALAGVVARMDRQQAEVEAMRGQMGSAARALESIGKLTGDLRGELQQQIREDLDRRLAAVEEQLHENLKTVRQETVNAMVATVETRLAPRIVRLESDVTGQASALSELRDCSLQSERSIQRLLTVLEKAIGPKAAAGAEPLSATGHLTGSAEAPRLTVMGGRGQR